MDTCAAGGAADAGELCAAFGDAQAQCHVRTDSVSMMWHDVRVHAQQEEQPLLESTVQPSETREHKRLRSRMSLAMWTSLVANVVLLAAKIVAYMLSHSSAILASAADSFVDIASQVHNSGHNNIHDSICSCWPLLQLRQDCHLHCVGSRPWHLRAAQYSTRASREAEAAASRHGTCTGHVDDDGDDKTS